MATMPAHAGARALVHRPRRAARHPHALGRKALRAEGDGHVERLVWTGADGREQTVVCDGLAASFGLRSESQLADLAGCAFDFDAQRARVDPAAAQARSSLPTVYLAGDGAGIGGADVAELQGRRTAWAVLEDLGRPVDGAAVARLDTALATQARFRAADRGRLAVLRPPGRRHRRHRGGVPLRGHHRRRPARGRNGPRRHGGQPRQGLHPHRHGPLPGRVCGHAAAELVARARGCPVAAGRLRASRR